MKKNIFFLLFSLILYLTLTSCSTTDPKLEPELALKLEDVSCTEAWLQLTTNNIQLPATINLLKNNSVTQTFSLSTKDSLLYIDSLHPNQTYKVIATMQQSSNVSNELSVTTMDTTSHSFTWQTFEFGQHSSSVLYDVAIIDENDIWAVGEIYMNDSLGNPDSKIYNAAHWNGNIWELKRIKTLFGGNLITVPLDGIFAFSTTDIWMVGSLPIHGDGTNWTMYDLRSTVDPNLSLSKVWGSRSNDIYFVGMNGSIAHYNGSSWTKIESGTATNINDAWGVFENGTSTVYCPVSSIFNPPQDKKILKIIGNKVDSVSWDKDKIVYSCWTENNNFLYLCGEGVFVNKFGTWTEINLPLGGKNSIRGIDINDIFIDGDNGFIAHYNGSTWQTYNNNYLKGYSRLNFKGNLVAIAGNYQGKAIIEIGIRN